MIREIPITEGFNIIHARGEAYEEALGGVVKQIKELEAKWDINFISNTSCKGDENPRVTNLYHATQTVTLTKKGKA